MKKMQCEVCGSTEIRKVDADTFECKSCGVQYSKDDVQKLLVEISGSVKVDGPVEVDKSKEIANTLRLADDAFNGGNYTQAYSYYSIVLQTDYDNYYATFMKGLSSAWQSTLAQDRVGELYESTNKALDLLNNQITDEALRTIIKVDYFSKICGYAFAYQNLATEHYNEYWELESSISDFWVWLMSLINTFKFAVGMYDQYMIALPEGEDTLEAVVNNAIDLCNLLGIKRSYKESASIDYGFVGPHVKDNWAEKSPTQEILFFYHNSLSCFNSVIYNLPHNVQVRTKEQEYWNKHPKEKVQMDQQKQMISQNDEKNKKGCLIFIILVIILVSIILAVYTESFVVFIAALLFLGVGAWFLLDKLKML